MEEGLRKYILKTALDRTTKEMCEDTEFCVSLLADIFNNNSSSCQIYNKDEESEGLKHLRREYEQNKDKQKMRNIS